MLMGHEHAEKAEEMLEIRALGPNVVARLVASVWEEGRGPLQAHQRLVYFTRHGQGHHNVFALDWRSRSQPGNPYESLDCPTDATLTEEGRNQARAAGATLRGRVPLDKLRIASSCMRRTMETTLLMRRALGADHVPISVHEELRERRYQRVGGVCVCCSLMASFFSPLRPSGLHRCDARVSLVELSAFFGPDAAAFDFSAVQQHDIDPLYTPQRETWPHLLERGARFLREHVMGKGSSDEPVIVVAHSSFLLGLMLGALETTDSRIVAPFATAEVRAIVLG